MSKRPSLKDRFAQEEAQLKLVAQGLQNATSYKGDKIQTPLGFDESALKVQRLAYIRMAERELLEKNVQAILTRAYELCIEDIGE